MHKNVFFKFFLGIIIFITISFVFIKKIHKTNHKTYVSYTKFIKNAKNNKVKSATIEGKKIIVKSKSGLIYYVASPGDLWMVKELIKDGVNVNGTIKINYNILLSTIYYLGPTLLIIVFWLYVFKQIQNIGRGGPFSFGRSRARLINENKKLIKFSDVAGCDEAKEEVSEIVEFLRDPTKFDKLGGRIPHGILLVGPPGNGKTLLARAIAGESKSPFFNISGSDFVEMFVGVGASRVRDMFNQAKTRSPCIIFIDEIDAIGRKRHASGGTHNDEREQTLNQMLVEMDGFETNTRVIVIAATNRVDILDKALLRPGRFDRQVYIGLPDMKGREDIIKVHLKKIKISNEINIKIIARGTPGFSGADLANLVNESALFAARKGKSCVDMTDFEYAKDKIFMGPEKKSSLIQKNIKKIIAYHESGHTILAKILPYADPVHKVTIIPRGKTLGITWQLPEYDYNIVSKSYLLDKLTILCGGRASEEIFLNLISTGSSDDFEKATSIARSMVSRFGMTKSMGTMVYSNIKDESDNIHKPISEETQKKIDLEISRIINKQYNIAKCLLYKNRNKVKIMTNILIEKETINSKQINNIMSNTL